MAYAQAPLVPGIAGSAAALVSEISSRRLHRSIVATARSYGDEALARLDVAAARIALDDVDGAHAAIRPVLALPVAQRIRQLDVGLARVRSALAVPRSARATLARSPATELDEFRASESARSLGSRR